jgi:glutamine amidotransferase PdxT
LFSASSSSTSEEAFRAVFIRAPAILRILPPLIVEDIEVTIDEATKKTILPQIEILATVQAILHISAREEVRKSISPINQEDEVYEVIVAVLQDQHMLATAFHPELTKDLRWHQMFADLVIAYQNRI